MNAIPFRALVVSSAVCLAHVVSAAEAPVGAHSSAPSSAVSPTKAGRMADEWTDAVKKALCVYESDDSFIRKVRFGYLEMFQVADVQPNGSNGLHLKKGASPVNQEFRRTYLGVNVEAASGTQFHTWIRPGGIPVRETYKNGRTKKNYSYTDFFDIWVKQDIAALKGLSVKVGKIGTNFTTDYQTSSSKLKCLERSMLCNQFGQDSNWGMNVTYAPDKQTSCFVECFFNDRAKAAKDNSSGCRDGRGFKDEFGYEDKCSAIIGASRKFAVTDGGYQEISGQYYHDFNNAYHGRRNPGDNNFGLGFRDAVSLGYTFKKDRWSVMSNLVAAFEQQAGHGSNNIGIQIQPVFALNKHVDLVARYVGMTGRGACKLSGDRYICTQTSAASWVDSLHTFYVGVDLYASAKNPDALKWMFGAEYTTARKGGSDCYNGWEYTSGIRWNF